MLTCISANDGGEKTRRNAPVFVQGIGVADVIWLPSRLQYQGFGVGVGEGLLNGPAVGRVNGAYASVHSIGAVMISPLTV